jgi:hypothetical protein
LITSVSERQSIRNLAIALGVGAVAALLVDAALQNALAAVRSPGRSSLTPWWVVGRVMERSTWIAAALLVWVFAPALSGIASKVWPADHVVGRVAALDGVGRAMIAMPLFWLLATWLVWAVKMTLAGSWASEGRVFMAGNYYFNVLLGYTPWASGGITLLALRRHVTDD